MDFSQQNQSNIKTTRTNTHIYTHTHTHMRKRNKQHHQAFCRIIESSSKEIAELKKMIDDGTCVPQFGQKADQICNSALEKFSQEAPLPDDDKENEALYDKKVCFVLWFLFLLFVKIN